MRRLILTYLPVILWGIAPPAFAGSIYIPIVADEIDGIAYETLISIANSGPGDAQFTPYFIRTGQDGTVRGDPEPSVLLIPGTTFLTVADYGGLGLVEFTGDSQLVVNARLVGAVASDEITGSQVPVISSENLTEAGRTAHLQDWTRDGVRITDFGLVNLGHQQAQCTIDVFRANGSALLSSFTAFWAPLSQRHFRDVLGLLGQFEIADVRLAATCDQRFYPYAVLYDLATGEAAFLGPSSVLGNSSLALPGECPIGALCFDFPGLLYATSPGDENIRDIEMAIVPGQVFSKIRFQLDFLFGGLSNSTPNRMHIFFWLWRNRYGANTFGRLSIKNTTFQLFNNVDLPNSAENKRQSGVVLVPGTTYHVDYTYDSVTNRKEAFLTTSTGELVGHVTLTSPVSPIVTQGAGFQVRLGSRPDENVANNPGWQWSNLKVDFIP